MAVLPDKSNHLVKNLEPDLSWELEESHGS